MGSQRKSLTECVTGFGDWVVRLVAAFQPIRIQPETKIENLNTTIVSGGESYQVRGGQIIAGKQRIQLRADSRGYARPVVVDSEVQGRDDAPSRNLELLDGEKRVFTRADLIPCQAQVARPLDREYERIIEQLKPVLANYYPRDLGALLVAAQIIRHEDRRRERELVDLLRRRLCDGYRGRGQMIYNLMRSCLLQQDLLSYLKRLRSTYPGDPRAAEDEFRRRWNDYLENGHPTAYFIASEDGRTDLYRELDRRFRRPTTTDVNVYSRTADRNKRTDAWCREYARDRGFSCQTAKTYQLGFGLAIRLRIRAPLNRSGL